MIRLSEAAVRLLGETQRFAYGRTLLAFLADNCNRKGYLGVSPMLEHGERDIRERITTLAGKAGGQMESTEEAATDESGQTGQDASSGEQETGHSGIL